jgi:hypothetical protein
MLYAFNQFDVVEKTEQVTLKAHIYNQASWVIDWLGEKESVAEEGLLLMKQLQSIFELRVWRDSETQSEKVVYQDLRGEDLLALGVWDRFESAWFCWISLSNVLSGYIGKRMT